MKTRRILASLHLYTVLVLWSTCTTQATLHTFPHNIHRSTTKVHSGDHELKITGFYDYTTFAFNFSLHSVTTGCEVTLSTNQTQSNYKTLGKMNWDKHIFFIYIRGLLDDKVNHFSKAYAAVKVSKESSNKFLPYKISSLWDTYLFTKRIDLSKLEISKIDFDMTLNQNCTSGESATPIAYKTSQNYSTVPTLEAHMASFDAYNYDFDYSQEATSDEMNMDASTATSLNSIFPDQLPGDYYSDNSIPPSQSIVDHEAIMATLYSVMFEYHLWGVEAPEVYNKFKFDDQDIEICSIEYQIIVDAPYIMEKCCRVEMAALKIFQNQNNDDLKMRCHDPYLLTKVIQCAVAIVSIMLVLMCPLMVKFVPRTTQWKTASTQFNSQTPCGSLRNPNPSQKDLETDRTKGSRIAWEDEKEQESIPLAEENQRYRRRNALAPPSGLSLHNFDDYIHLDSDSEFKLGIRIVLSRLLLYHVDSAVLNVLRRFAFLWLSWVSINFATFQLLLYFKTDLRMILWMLALPIKLYDLVDYICHNHLYLTTAEEIFYTRLYSYILLVPTLLTLVQFILLMPILGRKPSLCKVLHKDDCKLHTTDVTSHTMRKLSLASEVQEGVPYPVFLYEDLVNRLSQLGDTEFWHHYWSYGPIKMPQWLTCTSENKVTVKVAKSLLKIVWYVIKIPLYLILILMHTIPAFSVWHTVVIQPDKLIHNFKKRPCGLIFLVYLFLIVGVSSIYLMLLNIFCLHWTAWIFIFIDAIRNIRTMLPKIIFVVSILVYIRNAFVRFEDDYRNLKATTFSVCQGLVARHRVKGQKVVCKVNANLLLLQINRKGDTFMPRFVFYEVCQVHMPYQRKVAHTILCLFITLFCVSLLFAIVIDYQVLDQFSELGETFITVITVSLPSLFGMLKSEGHRALMAAKLYNNVEVTIQKLISIEDTCDNVPDMEQVLRTRYKLFNPLGQVEIV